MDLVAESPAGEDDAAMPTRAAHPEESPRFVAGTMTGTSIDGDLDAALVELRGKGLGMQARFVAGLSHPLGDVADGLRRIAAQEPMTAGELTRIARAFGDAHARALAELCSGAGVQPDLAVGGEAGGVAREVLQDLAQPHAIGAHREGTFASHGQVHPAALDGRDPWPPKPSSWPRHAGGPAANSPASAPRRSGPRTSGPPSEARPIIRS